MLLTISCADLQLREFDFQFYSVCDSLPAGPALPCTQDPVLPAPVWRRWLAPLSPSLWLLLLLSFLLALLLLWVSVRLAPAERRGRPPLGELACRLAAPWAWPAGWTPRAASTRAATAAWAAFHLVVVLLYLVHLPPHLTPRPAPRLATVPEVLARGGNHAVLGGGSTQQLLRVTPPHPTSPHLKSTQLFAELEESLAQGAVVDVGDGGLPGGGPGGGGGGRHHGGGAAHRRPPRRRRLLPLHRRQPRGQALRIRLSQRSHLHLKKTNKLQLVKRGTD